MVAGQPDFWRKQTTATPLFDDMLWSRPENRLQAGRLLVVGGNAHGFAAPAEAYSLANKAGVGSVRVMLPDALQKNVSKLFPEAEYAPSTPSGSFATNALGELLPAAQAADGVLLAGNLGRNSETAILLESFLAKYDGQLALTKDAIEYVSSQPTLVQQRQNTLLVLSFSQLQKLVSALKFPKAVSLQMDLLRAVDLLHELTTQFPFFIITKHLDTIFVAVGGQVSSTPCPVDERLWRLRVASAAAVWWLQNPGQPFAALTTSLVV